MTETERAALEAAYAALSEVCATTIPSDAMTAARDAAAAALKAAGYKLRPAQAQDTKGQEPAAEHVHDWEHVGTVREDAEGERVTLYRHDSWPAEQWSLIPDYIDDPVAFASERITVAEFVRVPATVSPVT